MGIRGIASRTQIHPESSLTDVKYSRLDNQTSEVAHQVIDKIREPKTEPKRLDPDKIKTYENIQSPALLSLCKLIKKFIPNLILELFFLKGTIDRVITESQKPIAAKTLTKQEEGLQKLEKESSPVDTGKAPVIRSSTNLLTGTTKVNKLDKQALAEVHQQAVSHHAPTLKGVSGSFTPYRVEISSDGKTAINENEVNRTSERAVDEASAKQRLQNLYMNSNPLKAPGDLDKREAVISCAAITSEGKALEFAHFIADQIKTQKQQNNGQHSFKNIALTQLNANVGLIGEAKLVSSEHELMEVIQKTIKELTGEDVRLVHTNTGMNGFTDHWATKGYQKENDWKINKEAYKDFAEILAEQSNIDDKSLQSLKQAIENKDFEALTGDIKNLPEVKLLKSLVCDDLSHPAQAATLSCLHKRLGIVTVIQCKSGLDRTGFVRCLDSSFSKLSEKLGLDGVESFIHHMDRALNTLQSLGEESRNYSELKTKIDAHPDKENLEKALELQHLMFSEIQTVALPITSLSAGVAGLKWNHKAEVKSSDSNPHVPRFVPTFAQGMDSSSQLREVKLTTVKDGVVLFTEAGLALTHGRSKSRGA